MHTEPAEEPANVIPDRLDRDSELGGDRVRGRSVRQQTEYLDLTRGQRPFVAGQKPNTVVHRNCDAKYPDDPVTGPHWSCAHFERNTNAVSIHDGDLVGRGEAAHDLS